MAKRQKSYSYYVLAPEPCEPSDVDGVFSSSEIREIAAAALDVADFYPDVYHGKKVEPKFDLSEALSQYLVYEEGFENYDPSSVDLLLKREKSSIDQAQALIDSVLSKMVIWESSGKKVDDSIIAAAIQEISDERSSEG